MKTLPLEEYKAVCDTFDEDVYKAIDLDTCVMQRKADGGPAPEAVAVQIEKLKSQLRNRGE